ncbi:MAG TPA: MobQ family relaxase [Metabacillus sp.]|nr:MobQ family relaxase [Metabacillus sp.]
MSLYYFHTKTINRGSQSAVASAAYRSGESLHSDFDGEVKSYKKREVQPDSFILAPSHAPEWVYDREKLWNEVEKVESNWNSRLAREVLVALPVELTNEQQKEMLKEFVIENFVNRGMVADISIHRDREHNPHAHILLTTRPFNEDGTWGNKKRKEYLKDENGNYIFDEKGRKKYKTISLTDWDQRETLLEWRKNFAEKINDYYKEYGINASVSHESYEKQGIDKIPRHRLSREEYQIEKREKEKAEKNGVEYRAKTYFGKLNQEIEKVNRKLEIIKQKIVSLSDYRRQVQNEKINELNNIRKSIQLSQEDWKAIKVVANRLNGFVDLRSAKDNLNKLGNWKKKLEYKECMLSAEERTLLIAKQTFEKEPSKTLLYGFIPSNFKQQFNELLSQFNEKKAKHEEAVKAFNDIYTMSERVYEIQKEFTVEEFRFLYPKYDALIKEDNEKTLEIKAKYVELFREEGTLRKTIPEFENEFHKLSSENVRLEKIIEQWKEINQSLVILERTKEKRKAEYRAHYNNYEPNNVYSSFVKYQESLQQLKDKEIEKGELQSKLFKEFRQRYPHVDVTFLERIDPKVQSKLLELHLRGENTGSITDDLAILREEHRAIKETSMLYDNEFEQTENNNSDSTGFLFDQLIRNAQKHESKNDELERKRKARRAKKLYREIGEIEL